MTDEEMLAIWPDGMLRCEMRSSTRHIALGGDNAFPQAHTDEPTPEVYAMRMVHPVQDVRARFDLRREIERRLLFDLVEHGIKEHLWPTAPEVRWSVYDERARRWFGMHWPPEPPRLSEPACG